MTDDIDSLKTDKLKRKRNDTLINIEKKIKALDAIDNGISVSAVSKEIGACEATIKHWILKERELREFWKECSHEIALKNEAKKKRSHNSTAIEVKIRVLDALKDGISMSVLSRQIGVAETTIKHWKMREKELREWKDKHANARLTRMRIRRPRNGSTDAATWIWYQEQKESGAPLSASLIKLQALRFWQLFESKEAKNFNATQGWYSRWRERHGIKSIYSSNDVPTDSTYHQDFLKIIEGMQPEQVFCADQMALHFRQLPKSTIGKNADDEADILTLQRERLTVVACANAPGTFKLPLMVVGDQATAAGDLRNSMVLYETQKNGMMSSNLFEQWFHEHFVPRVKLFLLSRNLPQKAVLFLDNCDRHKSFEKEGMRVELLPGHITSAFQPMTQGCLQKVKRFYRLSFMSFMLERLKGGGILAEVLKRITVQEAGFWLATAWNCVDESVIRRAWRILWPELMDSCSTTNSYPEADIDQKNQDDEPNEQRKLSNEFCEALKFHNGFINLDLNQVTTWLNPTKLWTEEDCLTEEEIVHLIETEEEEEIDEDEENLGQSPNDSSNPGPFFFVSNVTSLGEALADDAPVEKPLVEFPIEQEPLVKDVLKALEDVITHIRGNIHYSTNDLVALQSIRNRMIAESKKNTPNLNISWNS